MFLNVTQFLILSFDALKIKATWVAAQKVLIMIVLVVVWCKNAIPGISSTNRHYPRWKPFSRVALQCKWISQEGVGRGWGAVGGRDAGKGDEIYWLNPSETRVSVRTQATKQWSMVNNRRANSLSTVRQIEGRLYIGPLCVWAL